jgi:preprotein translocase SecE subunit
VARISKPSPEVDAPDGPPAPLEHAAPNAEIAELHETDPTLDDGPGNGNGHGGGSRRRRGGGGGGGGDDSGGELEPTPSSPAPSRHRNGLIAFARGSWRELQRVQWPDQRQVTQATGVVIGFVIVAGAYLALADFVATKIVHFILS